MRTSTRMQWITALALVTTVVACSDTVTSPGNGGEAADAAVEFRQKARAAAEAVLETVPDDVDLSVEVMTRMLLVAGSGPALA